jgi:hypothetical protein
MEIRVSNSYFDFGVVVSKRGERTHGEGNTKSCCVKMEEKNSDCDTNESEMEFQGLFGSWRGLTLLLHRYCCEWPRTMMA